MHKTKQHDGPGWGSPENKAQRTPPQAQQPTNDLNVSATVPLVSPEEVKADLPMSATATRCVIESRDTIRQILGGFDRRMLVIIGPCSIHDEKAAFEYAGHLHELSEQVSDQLFLAMRVYFDKPRTTLGWKGLINDPYLDGSFAVETGIRKARQILLKINELNVPAATELLDPITPQYIADLISWASIGARTTQSQTHRMMASGLSMPVGYKNSTEGNLQVAIDAMQAARSPHSFLGIDQTGRTAVVKTRGNHWGHLILRGGADGPNYGPDHVAGANRMLQKANLPAVIMIDCSHANSGKKCKNQQKVWRDVVEQRLSGTTSLVGLLVESHLFEGSQPFNHDPSKLKYGVSITDECMGWEETRGLLLETADILRQGPKHA